MSSPCDSQALLVGRKEIRQSDWTGKQRAREKVVVSSHAKAIRKGGNDANRRIRMQWHLTG
jgi:hypothetical protein